MDRLTTQETALLTQQEEVISRGLQTFYEVGEALLTIRDQRLYRERYATFEAYCRERWQMSRPRAYEFINAAHVMTDLSAIADKLPATESQVRPLSRLNSAEERQSAWEAAQAAAEEEGVPVAARHVHAAVDALCHIDDEPLTPYQAEVARLYESQRPALYMSETNEWYTPAQYIEAARAVMGGIDVDPASNATAQETIRATTYYTQETDGLAHDWPGRVWLNPPYGVEEGTSNAGLWAERLIAQYTLGITTEAVLLVNANTDRKWFRCLFAYPVCFTDHRIKFTTPLHNRQQPVSGSAIVYFGENLAAFAEHFAQFGGIMVPYAK